LRIDRTCLGGSSQEPLCAPVVEAIELFRANLSEIDLSQKKSGPSQLIKLGLEKLVGLEGWEKKFLFSREAHTSLPNANYTMNYLFVEQKCHCGFRHKVFFHLCFDNRQAIGTHLLRFKLATFSGENQSVDKPVAVAVVADSGARSSFGWDNSASTYEEFEQAVEFEYAQVLDLTLHFLVIRQ